MNFEYFAELTKEHQYEEIQIIGRDAVLQGKQTYLIAMTRREDQAELCMLLYREKEPEKQRNRMGIEHGSNREWMKDNTSEGFMGMDTSMKTLSIDGTVFECRQSQAGELHTSDLNSLLLLANIAAAGWQLPKDHLFFKEDWERIELHRVTFQCPCGQLPEWENAKIRVVWNMSLRRYLIEKQVRLLIGDDAKDPECETQIAFTIRNEDGMIQDGICYIHNVRLENPWEEIDLRFADPDYQKRMLEYMTPEEFASMRQSSCEAMEQECPRGMYFVDVEYECTLDLDLKFYLSEYLDCEPNRSERSVVMMLGIMGEEEQGIHGGKLKHALIQQPVPGDRKEVAAELFEAHKVLPEWEEELV